jgi:HAD superfamily hydrolase (TIGR01549 family)
LVQRAIPRPQAVQAVFFDVGFTLLFADPGEVDIAHTACAERGHAVPRECLEQHAPAATTALRRLAKANPDTWSDERAIQAAWISFFTHLIRPCLAGVPAREVDECARAAFAIFDEAQSYALYPDALPVLMALRERGLKLGVISDWGIGLGLILRHHDLIKYFDFAAISASVRLAKPNPALFETALRRADVIPDYAVHIGDSYVLDVLGARAAGITPVLLDRSGRLSENDVDCLLVHDLYGLLDLLQVARPPATVLP